MPLRLPIRPLFRPKANLLTLRPNRHTHSRSLDLHNLDAKSTSSASPIDVSRLSPLALSQIPKSDFVFFPDFLQKSDQDILLRAALAKLDASRSMPREIRTARKAARALEAQGRINASSTSEAQWPTFLPDELYDFDEGHYDGVIHRYREMHLSNWPSEPAPALESILDRVYSLAVELLGRPREKTQTHLLQLAADGEILPHIDNIEASGSAIVGVSLGAERVMRMSRHGEPDADSQESGSSFDVLLKPGSVYIQRDAVRYNFDHSILKEANFRGREIISGPRLSVMIRDLNPKGPSL